MTDHVKARLDRDWAEFLDALNAAYEDTYRELVAMAAAVGELDSAQLVKVEWPDNGRVTVGMYAGMRSKRRDDDN